MELLSKVFAKPKYITAGAISAFAFFALLAFTSGMVLLRPFGINPFIEPGQVGLNIVIAVLFGANVGVLLHNKDLNGPAAGGTALGAFAALMTSSCPFCQPLAFLALGLGGLGALLAGLGALVSLVSVALLSISLKKGLEGADGMCKSRRR
ncbi:MAG: hypothetical protein V1827_00930 [Candidatus Micrarchaeota archaeon]